MGRKNFKLNEKNIKGFVVKQMIFVIGIVIAASVLGIVKSAANTVSADTIVESVAGQFSGRASKLEMDVAVKTANSLGGVVSIVATLIILILVILLALEWIPVVRGAFKKINTRSKE
jgi:hypothetical protein